MKLLNLGCGQRFHPDWTNIDFVSTNPKVIGHNLLNDIPFGDNNFNVVYHSHVLEHFEKLDGVRFINECFRVLCPGGIIRVAVPDLEMITRNYLSNLEKATQADEPAMLNYEWIMLELFDQTVRNQSGGAMAKYLFQDELKNEEFVYSRIGTEAKTIRESYFKNKISQKPDHKIEPRNLLLSKFKNLFKIDFYKNKLKQKLFSDDLKYIQTGKFRHSGEIHQWMYDRYSLSKLLNECGFTEIKIRTAFESYIPEWNNYELESKNGYIYKSDSLFMEAIKK